MMNLGILILTVLTSSSILLRAETLPFEAKAELEHLNFLLKPKTWKLPSDVVADSVKGNGRMANLVFKEKHGDSDFHSTVGSGLDAVKGEEFWVYYFPDSEIWRLLSKGQNSISATGNSWTFPTEWKGPKSFITTEQALRYEIKTTYDMAKNGNEVILAQRTLHDKKTGHTIIQQVGFHYASIPPKKAEQE